MHTPGESHGVKIVKNAGNLFVDVALRAASIQKKISFLYLLNFLQVAKLGYLLGFELWEYARQLSFEKCCRMH